MRELECVHTCSRSCLSLWSWDSSCLLWSSSICIRASRRPLCCRSNLASAISSASRVHCGDTGSISGGDGSGERPFLSCVFFRRSYSACSFLHRWTEMRSLPTTSSGSGPGTDGFEWGQWTFQPDYLTQSWRVRRSLSNGKGSNFKNKGDVQSYSRYRGWVDEPYHETMGTIC